MLETALQDLRYAGRKLWSSPGFTIPAVLILGLGIGATSAMYSVLHAVVIEPLPFAQPERLARLYHLSDEWSRVPSSPGHYLAFQEQAESLETLAAFRHRSAIVAGPAGPEQMTGMFTLGPVFDLLGIPVAIGRGPATSDEEPGAPQVIVLSHQANQLLLDPDLDPLGQTVILNGSARTVVGVAPPGLGFPHQDVMFWSPAQGVEMDSFNSVLTIYVRLASGHSLEQAAAELSLIGRRLREANPKAQLGEVVLQPLRDSMIQSVKGPLLWLMGAVALVLLIACANVANLLLARAFGRRHEMAVRRALGAARPRLARQLLTESLLLAALGGAAGLAVAIVGLRAALAVFGDQLPRSEGIALDANVLAFALGASLVASVLFGVVPCLSLSNAGRHGGSTVLAAGGRTSRNLAPRMALTVAQTALAVVLLVGAGLLLRSLGETLEVDPGFDPEEGFSFSVWLPRTGYEEEMASLRFHDQLQQRFAGLAGVESVARASFLPLNHRTGWASSVKVKGRAEGEGVFLYRLVSTDYFPVIGARRLEGRLFEESDRTGRPVVVINESMSRRLWPDGDALGAVITLADPEDPLIAEATVVGVVSDARDLDLGAAPRPVLYAPHYLVPWYGRFEYVVRSPVGPQGLLPGLRRELAALDGGVPLHRVRTLGALIDENVAGSRASATLAGTFALLALVLAAVGLFSVSAYRVAQRSRELAIRMALGATTANIGGLVLRQGLIQAVAGLGVGLFGALLLSRFLESQLFGISPRDPVTLAATTLLLLAAMAAASLPVARRAARIAPIELLHEE